MRSCPYLAGNPVFQHSRAFKALLEPATAMPPQAASLPLIHGILALSQAPCIATAEACSLMAASTGADLCGVLQTCSS